MWAEENWRSAMTHSVELMPRIRRMLSTQQVAVEALAGIAVSLGPGSFTGLRIGLAAAKGLALPYHLPLVGVPALDAAAYPYRTAGQKVWAILEAGRGRIGVACYDWVEGEWAQIVAPTLTTWQGLRQMATEPAIFTGEIGDPAQLGEAATVPTPALRLRRAACLAELGALRLARDDVDDIATLAPLYLQHPAVEA